MRGLHCMDDSPDSMYLELETFDKNGTEYVRVLNPEVGGWEESDWPMRYTREDKHIITKPQP